MGFEYDVDFCDFNLKNSKKEVFFVVSQDYEEDRLENAALKKFLSVDKALNFARTVSQKSPSLFLTFKKISSYDREEYVKLTKEE